ncbi:MAG: DoxX family protein [Chitinophagales bacterium]|nr:DoxX family protein [Chitinophagales bacterium]MDW8426935.1 DoxX family protein [Chitinophagales bacterium]
MTWAEQLDSWSQRNLSAFIFGLRLVLALVLFVKGYMFLFRIHELQEVMTALDMSKINMPLALIVGWAHLICGLFIGVGMLTRICCLISFPILVGAVFYVNIRQGFVTSTEWLVSVVVLYLIIFFFVYGNGPISIVRLFARSENLS